MSDRAWRSLVAACVLAGLAVRIGAVLGRPHLHPAGDAAEYWLISNYVVEGKGWIEPIVYHGTGVSVPTAKLPPLYTLLLMPCSLLGFKSYFAHRIWSGVLSASGVLVGAALGRQVAGRWAGVLTAAGIALYPNIWMPAEVGLSETVSPILAMLVLLAAYRLWCSPGWRRAAVLGVAIGFATLARDEMVVFAGLILLPLAYGGRRAGRSWRERFRLLASGLLGVLVVVSPWVGFNMSRFSRPVFVTDRFGATLASANCDTTWHGPLAGYWVQSCAIAAEAGATGDEPARDAVATRVGLRYLSAHPGGLPKVELERLGRTFGLWRVGQQLDFDAFLDGRPRPWVQVGLYCFYGLAVLAPFGLFRLRREGVLTFPLWAVLGDVVLVVLVTYGQTRFRATLEPVLVLLGAVAVGWAARLPFDPGRPLVDCGVAGPVECGVAGPGGGPDGAFRPGRPATASSPEPSGPRSGPPPAFGPPSASSA
ncbi:MAG TPA: glycosyltransferase family 39 protein [Acidimicrobiales bacterium]|nr:glycosyltransferase family 39 protein [Acidimicrobiales bacterium]